LTLTHYEYWALTEGGGAHEFFNSETQTLSQADGRLADHLLKIKRAPEQATMMSPWVEVLFT